MKTITRRIALLLAVMLLCVLSFSVFAEDSELVTLKVYGKENSGLDWNKQFMTQYVREHLGINMEITTFTNEQWQNQFSLMLTMHELPDLFLGCQTDKAEINAIGIDGFLLDFSQYEDIMPNYVAMKEKYPMWAAYQKTDSGAVYGFARIFPSRLGLTSAMNAFINLDWLEVVGMEVPTNVDELYEVLVAFKEQDANGNGNPDDEIPITFNGSQCYRTIWTLQTAFGINNAGAGELMMADDYGNVYPSFTSENYRAYTEYMHKLYAEGLLDEQCFVQTVEECQDKIRSNKVGIFADWSGLFSAIGDADPEVQLHYALFVGIASDYTDGNRDIMMGNCGYAAGCRTFASATTEHPEEVCRLVDFTLSEECAMVSDYGEEGVTFSFVSDAFGNVYPSTAGYWEDKYETEGAFKKMIALDEGFKLWRASYTDNMIESATDEMLEQMIYSDPTFSYTANAIKEKAMREVDRLITPFPDLAFTDSENAEIAALKTDINSYKGTMFSSFVIGTADIDEEWDTYIAELNTIGLERLTELYQIAYDRMMK